jgi:hypothetical protein
MNTADSKKPCPHCGGEHIAPGTAAEEYAQANRCREQEWLDIQAERLAWYEEHWDRDDPEA